MAIFSFHKNVNIGSSQATNSENWKKIVNIFLNIESEERRIKNLYYYSNLYRKRKR